MSHRKELKIYFIVFLAFMLGFSAIAPTVFRWYFQHFNDNIHQRTSLHIEVIRDLNEIETSLYIYQKSFVCYLKSSDENCLLSMKESKQKVLDRFTYVEDFNKNEFSGSWIDVTDFAPEKVENELRKMLSDYNTDKSVLRTTEFQRLFYLVRWYSKTYFFDSVKRLKEKLATDLNGPLPDISVETEQNRVDLLYLGFKELKDHYNRLFWNYSSSENTRFKDLTDRYQVIILSGFSITILFTILLGLKVLKLFTIEKHSKKEILALGARDKVTGLFNYSSMKILLAQEVAGSIRMKRPISMLIIRIDSFDTVEKESGTGAAEQLILEVSETLKKFCRAYDRLYKYDANTFLVIFPETPPRVLNKIASRFHAKLLKKKFPLYKGKSKVVAVIRMGAACFPINGKTTDDLLKSCEQALTSDFNANKLFTAEQLSKTNLFAEEPPEPTTKPTPQEVTKPSEPVITESAAELPAPLTPASEENEIPEVISALSQNESDKPADLPENTSDVKILHQVKEDIIMVDIDRNRDDIAEKFSKQAKGSDAS